MALPLTPEAAEHCNKLLAELLAKIEPINLTAATLATGTAFIRTSLCGSTLKMREVFPLIQSPSSSPQDT